MYSVLPYPQVLFRNQFPPAIQTFDSSIDQDGHPGAICRLQGVHEATAHRILILICFNAVPGRWIEIFTLQGKPI